MEENSNGIQYFLARIREFEKAYGMESWKFQFLYENNREVLPGYNGRSAVDYSQWAFLWENVSQADGMCCESPPSVVCDTDQQKPEGSSGFCFSGGKIDHFAAPLSRSLCRSDFGQERTKRYRRYQRPIVATTQES